MKRLLTVLCALIPFMIFATDSSKVEPAKIATDSVISESSASIQFETIQAVDNSVWQNLVDNILGENLDVAGYISCFLFAFIGLFLRWYWRSRKGVKNNPNSPNKFHWGYWLNRNLLPKLFSCMATFLIIFLSLRFSFELVGLLPSMILSLIVGLSIDKVSDLLKNLKLPVKSEKRR
jgi:hypothetical protein